MLRLAATGHRWKAVGRTAMLGEMTSSRSTFYSGSTLNRLSFKRTDEAFLSEALTRGSTRVLAFDALNPLVIEEGGETQQKGSAGRLRLGYLTWSDLQEVGVYNVYDTTRATSSGDQRDGALGEASGQSRPQPQLVFLGVDERRVESQKDTSQQEAPPAYFALDATHFDKIHQQVKAKPGWSFHEARSSGDKLVPEEASIFAQARALIDWNGRNQYCPACGRKTHSVWAGHKRQCFLHPDEGQMEAEKEDKPPCISKKGLHSFNYPRTDPVVIMAIISEKRDKLLLGRQKRWPPHFYSCLAGFIEPGEALEESVRREVWEEAGVEIDQVKYIASQPWPFPSQLMIGCLAFIKAGSTDVINLDNDKELEAAYWFSKESLSKAIESRASNLSRQEINQLDPDQSDSTTVKTTAMHATAASSASSSTEVELRIPPSTAIAHTLIEWCVQNLDRLGQDAKI